MKSWFLSASLIVLFLPYFSYGYAFNSESNWGQLQSYRKESIRVSVIEPSDIPRIWSVMVSDPIISWSNLGGDCAARAARSCRQIEKQLGITCAKIYVDCCANSNNCTYQNERRQCLSFKGREFYVWGYHVAPVFILRNELGVESPVVFDPGMFSEVSSPQVLSPAQWKSKLNPKGVHQLYYGNRYASYGIDQSTLYKEDYPGMVEQGETDLMKLKAKE